MICVLYTKLIELIEFRRCLKCLYRERRSSIGVILFNGILLLIAMWYDWKCYRIPNRLIWVGLGISFLYQYFYYKGEGIETWLWGIGISFLILFPFSLVRMIGAGDVKLAMVIGGFWGHTVTIKILCIAFIIGAIISLGKMLWHRNLLYRLQYLANYTFMVFARRKIIKYIETEEIDEKTVIHFAIPMAIAFFAVALKLV